MFHVSLEALRSSVAQNSRCHFHPLSKRCRADASYPPMISPVHHGRLRAAFAAQGRWFASRLEKDGLGYGHLMRDYLAANAAQERLPAAGGILHMDCRRHISGDVLLCVAG
jgi:hypothetical protein